MEEDRTSWIRRGTRFSDKAPIEEPEGRSWILVVDKRALREPFAVNPNDARGRQESRPLLVGTP
jgi:hypothetical protein